MRGSVGWYRKDFELPDKRAALEWAVRFESVNYRSRVWLNGREIGAQRRAPTSRSSSRLKGLKRARRQPARGARRLAPPADRLPALGPEHHRQRRPAAGGTTAGSSARSTSRSSTRCSSTPCACCPTLPCGSCPATVDFTLALENVTGARPARPRHRARYGSQRIGLGTRCGARRQGASSSAGRVRSLKRARCGRPSSPYLYPVKITVSSGGRTVGTYSLKSGVRSIKVSRGRLYLNGRRVELPRRRRARGHARAGLRGRRRVPRAARRARRRRSARR